MPSALIADDEPLLAQALRAELARQWPELDVIGMAGDGLGAAQQALALRPDVLFFDIRMPGQDGLSAAAQVADEWPHDAGPLPLLVFVTAFEQHAIAAFDAQALDYVLKPVDGDRLHKTVNRLQSALSARAEQAGSKPNFDVTQWQALLQAAGAGLPLAAGHGVAPLRFIQAAGVGNQQLHMVPVPEVLYFEAADKYVRVITADDEYLIRTPLRQLMQQLPPDLFWQVQRGVLVRADAIANVQREESGKMWLRLRGRPEDERLPVGRLYAHLFKAM